MKEKKVKVIDKVIDKIIFVFKSIKFYFSIYTNIKNNNIEKTEKTIVINSGRFSTYNYYIECFFAWILFRNGNNVHILIDDGMLARDEIEKFNNNYIYFYHDTNKFKKNYYIFL